MWCMSWCFIFLHHGIRTVDHTLTSERNELGQQNFLLIAVPINASFTLSDHLTMLLIPLPFRLRTSFISKTHSSHGGFQLPCLFSSRLQSIVNTLKLLSRSLLLSSCFGFPDMIGALFIIDEATPPHELRKSFELTTSAGTSSGVLHTLILPRRLPKITLVSSVQMTFFQSFKVQSLYHMQNW